MTTSTKELTITVNSDLHQEFEDMCIAFGTTPQSALEGLMKEGLKLVNSSVYQELATQRAYQRIKGYTSQHDDEHKQGEIALAAATFAEAAAYHTRHDTETDSVELPDHIRRMWPFIGGFTDREPRAIMIRAAAMLVAEIERLDRKNTAE